eukprot:CAMPEP_0181397658 /NCGR_PEP_ID=MMETSP1110-20121109/606_1 /TAXON_ID=174948 /ORGANISM="Symbiodinium sp., Strain CCMP421" /LENGTH=61 /DNA_ID=CAMNT_0023519519 /DNA_START=238 /DNA_END=423 /DNA_ORIENTATION=-
MPSGKVKAPRPVDEFAKSYEEGMNNYYMHRYNEYKRLGYSDQEASDKAYIDLVQLANTTEL